MEEISKKDGIIEYKQTFFSRTWIVKIENLLGGWRANIMCRFEISVIPDGSPNPAKSEPWTQSLPDVAPKWQGTHMVPESGQKSVLNSEPGIVLHPGWAWPQNKTKTNKQASKNHSYLHFRLHKKFQVIPGD